MKEKEGGVVMNNILLFGLIVVGIVCLMKDRVPYIGNLPGDLCFRGQGWVLYIPITSVLLVSLILGFLIGLFRQH